VRFTVSTSGTDADWVVKVIDVFPDDARGLPAPERTTGVRLGGYQMLVRGDVLRGKFRDGMDRPEPFTPNEPTALTFTMQDAFHTFQPGHRIMVQVQSSWFPMIDLNPGTFLHLIDVTAADFRKTTQRVYHSVARPSSIELTVAR
jgi:predicted acyl esterase